MDFETPEADAAEQARVEEPVPEDDEPAEVQGGAGAPDAEVDPADYADQQRVVPDEEDYDR